MKLMSLIYKPQIDLNKQILNCNFHRIYYYFEQQTGE